MMFVDTQIPHLLDAGFKRENISWEVVEVDFDQECKYYATKLYDCSKMHQRLSYLKKKLASEKYNKALA